MKCCLNFELDTYLDALKVFPKNADKLHTERGDAYLQKTDIFKFLMWYSYPGSTKLYPLNIERVREILELNKQNKPAADLDKVKVILQAPADQEPEHVEQQSVIRRKTKIHVVVGKAEILTRVKIANNVLPPITHKQENIAISDIIEIIEDHMRLSLM